MTSKYDSFTFIKGKPRPKYQVSIYKLINDYLLIIKKYYLCYISWDS